MGAAFAQPAGVAAGAHTATAAAGAMPFALALAAFGAARAAATLLHEFGHLVAAALVARRRPRAERTAAGCLFSWANARGNQGALWWADLASAGLAGAAARALKRSSDQTSDPSAACSCAHVDVPLRLSRREGQAVSLAGPLASLAAALAAAALAACRPGLASAGALLGACEVLLGGLASDGARLVRPHSSTRFFCGNFGALVRRSLDEWGYVPSWLFGMMTYMIQVTMVRGGQAGGVVAFVANGASDIRGIRQRVVNGKRTDLGVVLIRAMRRNLALHAFRACFYRKNPSPAVLCMGHTRFATSSFPAVNETHPHQWLPRRDVVRWCYAPNEGAFLRQDREAEIYITHNGDFDYFEMWGREVTYEHVGLWLEKVHDHTNYAKGDSPKVAGLVDLLATQGMWAASVKLAYYAELSYGLDAVFEGGRVARDADYAAPPLEAFEAVAEIFERHFEAHARDLGTDPYVVARLSRAVRGCPPAERPGGPLSAFAAAVVAELHQRALQLPLVANCSGEAAARFAHAAVDAFLHNDAYTATRLFLTHARGSFGLVVGSALEEGTVVVAAKGQPMAIAYSATDSVVLFGSEHTALKVPFGEGKPGAVEFRYDLDEVSGEVVEMRLADLPRLRQLRRASALLGPDLNLGVSRTSAAPMTRARLALRRGRLSSVQLASAMAGAPAAALAALKRAGSIHSLKIQTAPKSPQGPAVDPEAGVPSGGRKRAGATGSGFPVVPPSRDALHLGGDLFMRHYALRTASELPGAAALRATGRLIDLRGNPYISPLPPPPRPGSDAVAKDLADVSKVLKAIREDWADAGGHNRLSAARFVELLLRRAHEKRTSEPANKVDLVITGCELSLWVAEQWAADLKRCLPQLNVLCVSANKIIDVYGSRRGENAPTGWAFTRRTADFSSAVGLAISHSGNTFATTQATLLLRMLSAGRTFVLVRNTDTLMSTIVGQRLDREAPRCPYVMTNGAGWRPAEPSSVACLALQQTLTELLLHTLLAFDKLAIHERPFGILISAADAHALDSLASVTVEKHVPLITGRGMRGEEAREPDCQQPGATRPSAYHANLVAAGRRWGMHVIEAPLIWAVVSVYIWISVFFGVSLFRVLISGYDHCSGGFCAPGYGIDPRFQWLHKFLDSWLYVWCILIFTLVLRLVQRRPLLARLGRRTVVIGEVPYAHQCLEAFLSKLFALSYSVASVDVHGANPADHLVHRFTHRVARGVLLAVGRPDGRLCAHTKAESSVMLSICQAKSIQNLGRSGGPEVVTVGHNPWHHEAMIDCRIVLPSERGQFLCEAVSGLKSFYVPRARRSSAVGSLRGGLSGLAKLAGLSNRGGGGGADDASIHAGFSPGEIMSAASAAQEKRRELTHLELLALKHKDALIGAESLLYARGRGAGAKPLPPRPAPAPAALEDGGDRVRPGTNAGAKDAAGEKAVRMHTICVHLDGAGFGAGDTRAPRSPKRAPKHAPFEPPATSGHGLRRFRAAAERVRAEVVRPRLERARRARGDPGGSFTGRFQNVVMKLVDERRAVMNPHSRAASDGLRGLSLPVKEALQGQAPLEELYESRLLSAERMCAFMVLFHAMAARVAAFPLLGFDLARSQSSLRVASTAAPASGAEIAQVLAAMAAKGEQREAGAGGAEGGKGAPLAALSMEQARRRLSLS